MTIESNLDSIAQSLKIIADLLTVQTATKAVTNAPISQAPTVAPVQVAAPVTPIPEPVVVPSVVSVPVPAAVVPVELPKSTASPVMPPAPVFTPAAPTPTVTAVSAAPTPALESPFKDKSAMMDFVMSSYRALGAEKGAKIQDVLTAMGYQNINDVPADKWVMLKSGIEALK